MPKTSFDAKFDLKAVALYSVISPDNVKQQGENFLEFVRLVNAQPLGDITKVLLIDGSYLQRHYSFKYSDAKNEKLLFEWREAQKQFIRQLQVPYEVISWAEIVKHASYEEAYREIKRSYDEGTDEELREIVASLAREFTYKGTIKQTMLCLLEECAGTLVLDKLYPGWYSTYPGVLNVAIQHVLKRFGVKPTFVQYTLGKVVKPAGDVVVRVNAAAAGSGAIASPVLTPTNFPFFSPEARVSRSSREIQAPNFPNTMSFQKRNHVWDVSCEIQFFDNSKNKAIEVLLTNIEEDRDDYLREKEKLTHPVVLEYKKQFTGYMIYYRVEIDHSEVLTTVDPFDILINQAKMEGSQLPPAAVAQTTSTEPYHAPSPQ